MLSPDQIDQYQQQGYLLLPNLIPEDHLARYSDRFKALATGAEPLSDAMKVMRDIMVVKGAATPPSELHGVNKLANFEADPILYAYTLEPKLLSAVRQLIDAESIYSLSTNIFNKPPGLAGRHPFHQDLRYFRIRPAHQIIGTWTALSPATRENGCLAVLPGTHRGALLNHGSPDWDYVNAGFYSVADADFSTRIHMEMQTGDTLLFHPLLVHGSGHNRSSGFRRAISSHYAAASCESPHRDWHQGKQARHIPQE